jgi:hypothetical protein
MAAPPITEEELQDIYTWVDQIPLSRPKRNIARDFADGGNGAWCSGFVSSQGRSRVVTRDSNSYYCVLYRISAVLVSEITKHFFPRMVELHNYSSSHSVGQKLYNWNTLNRMFTFCRPFNFFSLKFECLFYCYFLLIWFGVVLGLHLCAEKVFKKMGFVIVKEDIDGAINAERGAVERILKFIRQKVCRDVILHVVILLGRITYPVLRIAVCLNVCCIPDGGFSSQIPGE